MKWVVTLQRELQQLQGIYPTVLKSQELQYPMLYDLRSPVKHNKLSFKDIEMRKRCYILPWHQAGVKMINQFEV
jgi:hypothetical protein